jgi:hypothetical protein
MKKKVGLITYHDTANHGAALQLYATLKMLAELGYDAEVIDYANSFRASIYNPKKRLYRELKNFEFVSSVKTIIGFYSIKQRMRSFDDFYSKYTKRSKFSFSDSLELKNLNESYDVFVCGSDQIWSPKNNGGDLSYFLDFVSDSSKTVSYASSFGAINIPIEWETDYAKCLGRIANLSVRESSGAVLISRLINRDVKVVVDPVFLLTAEEWIGLLDESKLPILKNQVDCDLLDYTAKPGMLKKFLALPGVRKKFGTITKFGTNITIKDIFSRNVRIQASAGPVEFIYKLHRSKFLFTSSFHGTVLAIILRKEFISCLSGNEGRDARIADLLVALGLEERIFRSDMTLSDVATPIDFEKVHKKLSKLRQNSIEYLTEALSRSSGS